MATPVFLLFFWLLKRTRKMDCVKLCEIKRNSLSLDTVAPARYFLLEFNFSSFPFFSLFPLSSFSLFHFFKLYRIFIWYLPFISSIIFSFPRNISPPNREKRDAVSRKYLNSENSEFCDGLVFSLFSIERERER